jgi:glutaredoxin
MTTDLEFLRGHRLSVYSAHGCPDCTRLEHWMRMRDVAHEQVFIDEHPTAAEKLENETGKQAVPYILVDDQRWVRGYHREERSRLSEALLLKELREAIDAKG